MLIFVVYLKKNIMMVTTERFTVKKIVKFGMLFGYRVYDSLEKKPTSFEYDEDEKYKADSRAEIMNILK